MNPSKYRKVDELNRDEFNELRRAMFCAVSDAEEGNCPYSCAEDIPDEEVIKNYSGMLFVVEDFVCNQYNQSI